MASDISTIQSLKAVDAWIDVINANINGGVRTAFKASRLKFAGSNTEVSRPGTSTNLPLQFPEPSLVTSNTVIDFTQGAVTQSTENSHLAIQGTGWFCVVDANSVNTTTGAVTLISTSRVFLTRDGEFRTNQNGLLTNSNGYFLVTMGVSNSTGSSVLDQVKAHAVFNNLDNSVPDVNKTSAVRLSDYVTNSFTSATVAGDGTTVLGMSGGNSITKVTLGQQSLQYTQFGSTVFNFGYTSTGISTQIKMEQSTSSDASLLNKSLEASNASMTQSVPELSLAQKLFSALTKVFQTKQTNIDGVINLIR